MWAVNGSYMDRIWIVYGAYVFAISYYEMRRLRSMPVQAKVISQYISYLKDYVIERNVPSRQIEALKQIFIDMEQQLLPELPLRT